MSTINYNGIKIPDINKIHETSQQFTNWRQSMGFKTEEEKQQEFEDNIKAIQERTEGLSDADSATDWYHAMETDPAKRAEWDRQAATTVGHGIGAIGTILSAGTLGWIPSLVSTGTGYAGGYGGYKLGEAIDNKYGTNTAPWLSFAGGMFGGAGGYKGLVKLGSKGLLKGTGNMYGNQFLGDVVGDKLGTEVAKTTLSKSEPLLNVGWAPTQTINVRRAGDLTEMYYPQRWDVVEEGANPFGVWLQGKYGIPRTDVTNPGKGAKAARARELFANRPQYVGNVSLNKPITVLGDVPDRSALSYTAERMGADGIIYNGYYDNGYNLNQGIFSFVKPELSRSSGQDARIMWMGPTTGKTTYAKTNHSIVDIDSLTKPIRKDVASRLGLDFRSPMVSESPEYQEAVVKMVNGWLQDPSNHGKTMVASTKFLLDPKHGIKFANEPFMPDFNTFVARNQARGFSETPEQLRKWYDSILAIKPDIKISNEFASDALKGYAQRPLTYFKTATYPGQSGMYSGRTVPTWQLPKGQRNQILNGHLKGDNAVRMFKEYGIADFPENSSIRSQIEKLVSEARERYGLVGRTDITDEEIAGSLYKRALELNGEGNAAVHSTGEPLLLFRGDTKRYNQLKDRWTPERLAKGKGTMDNSLGNLFLGDISGKGQGVDRYFISGTDLFEPRMQGSATGARGKLGTVVDGGGEGIQGTTIPYIPKDAYKLSTYQTYAGPYSLYKFPGKYSETGVSDLNSFIVRTPAVRDATGEISVLADDYIMKTKHYKGPNIDDFDGPTYDGVNPTVRDAMAKHYQAVLDDAESNNQGLLFSEGLTDETAKKFNGIHPYRREHERYDYYALPNFNRQNAKHLFGWDLRRPVQWNVDNIYLEKGGKIENPDH